jgi:hypothetical protein
MEKKANKTISFDQLPDKDKKKIRKRYDHLSKKHPGLTEQQIMEKIGKKMNMELNME